MSDKSDDDDQPLGLERVYPLKIAVEKFLGAPWTVSSLRTEIRNGNLIPVRIAGRLAVSEKAIMGMLEACRYVPKVLPVRQPPVDTARARAALRALLESKRKANNRDR